MSVIKICSQCNREFQVKPSHANKRTYCSKECMSKAYRKERKKIICLNCSIEFEVYDNKYRENAKFCNKKCMGQYMSNDRHWNYIDGRRKDPAKYNEYSKRYNTKYYKLNKEKIKIRSFLYKPKLRVGVEVGNYSYEQWLGLLEKYKYKCYYCNTELAKEEGRNMATRDHIIPLSRGGKDELDNIVPSCKSCNGSKSDKLISEWKV